MCRSISGISRISRGMLVNGRVRMMVIINNDNIIYWGYGGVSANMPLLILLIPLISAQDDEARDSRR